MTATTPKAAGHLIPGNAALGRAIRRLRKKRGATIEGLALDAGMHPTYLSGIERGVRNPTWEVLRGLSWALDVSVATIAADAEAEAELAKRTEQARRELGMAA